MDIWEHSVTFEGDLIHGWGGGQLLWPSSTWIMGQQHLEGKIKSSGQQVPKGIVTNTPQPGGKQLCNTLGEDASFFQFANIFPKGESLGASAKERNPSRIVLFCLQCVHFHRNLIYGKGFEFPFILIKFSFPFNFFPTFLLWKFSNRQESWGHSIINSHIPTV